MIQFKVAETEAECDAALNLVATVFAPHARIDDYEAYKKTLWHEDPDYAPENIVLALDGAGAVCGVIRIVPRILVRHQQRFKTAGISSVCLAEEHRGVGRSLDLMRYALARCAENDYDLSLLFSRRALDHYYNRFGFWGLSAYSKAVIRAVTPTSQVSVDGVEIGAFDLDEVERYNTLYAECYGDSFGYVVRKPAHWMLIGQRLAWEQEVRFATLICKGRVIGYVAVDRYNVVEMAADADILDIADIIALLRRFDLCSADAPCAIPADHRLLRDVGCQRDVTISHRSCAYGGHMVKVLNTARVQSLWLQRMAVILARVGARPGERKIGDLAVNWDGELLSSASLKGDDMDYKTTCLLLGAQDVGPHRDRGIDTIDRLPFNVSFFDHL